MLSAMKRARQGLTSYLKHDFNCRMRPRCGLKQLAFGCIQPHVHRLNAMRVLRLRMLAV
jgi:hypothetical protein